MNPLSSLFESLHHNSISQATLALLSRQQRVAGIMGGHDEPRNCPTYAAIAQIARALSRQGFFMVSGGGPGEMKATHLGAFFRFQPEESLGEAIHSLKAQPSLPADTGNVITPRGKIDDKILRALHSWITPAFALSGTLGRPRRESSDADLALRA